MNAIRTEYTPPQPLANQPGTIIAYTRLDSKNWIHSYQTITGGKLPKLKHHQAAAKAILDRHYPDWRTHHVLVSAWYCADTYVHIAALKAELGAEKL